MNQFARGDFSFLRDKDERLMLEDAFQAVSKAEAWTLLKEPSMPGEGGFMFGKHPAIEAISSSMKYEGHSGASYAMTMRQMEFIAKNGWESYLTQTAGKQVAPKNTACPCRAAQGYISGWCGVAGGGVPGCDH
jgi:hypothetical protein